MLVLNMHRFMELLPGIPEYDAEKEEEQRKALEDLFFKILEAKDIAEIEQFQNVDFVDLLEQARGIVGGYDVDSCARNKTIKGGLSLKSIPHRRLC